MIEFFLLPGSEQTRKSSMLNLAYKEVHFFVFFVPYQTIGALQFGNYRVATTKISIEVKIDFILFYNLL